MRALILLLLGGIQWVFAGSLVKLVHYQRRARKSKEKGTESNSIVFDVDYF